jgi:hypothetical protein
VQDWRHYAHAEVCSRHLEPTRASACTLATLKRIIKKMLGMETEPKSGVHSCHERRPRAFEWHLDAYWHLQEYILVARA